VTDMARELRTARVDRGLSLVDVARAAGLSTATVSRVERGLAEKVSVVMIARLLAIVGLEFGARAYPGGQPLRDAGHVALLDAFRAGLHRSIRWATEVPLPSPGDQRAWDALIRGADWRYGIEAETAPRDAQALLRRLELKRRDGGVDGVILLLRASRHTSAFLRDAGELLRSNLPASPDRTRELLRAGVQPPGSSIVVL
jgi:transcriptional regulator with XRE-family HTH domain